MPTIHGYFTDDDASALAEADQRFGLYPNGSATALTLGSSDYVVVHGLNILTGGAITVTVFDGANNAAAAGEVIAKVTVNGNYNVPLVRPFVCQKGTYPKVLTSGAGQVDVTLNGEITSVAPH